MEIAPGRAAGAEVVVLDKLTYAGGFGRLRDIDACAY
jgi:dTDP-D-glucose 4,6-dehydratase